MPRWLDPTEQTNCLHYRARFIDADNSGWREWTCEGCNRALTLWWFITTLAPRSTLLASFLPPITRLKRPHA